MDPTTVESLKEALTPLMEKLGQGGEAAWEIAVRQQQVEAIRGLVWPIPLAVALFASWRFYRWAKDWNGAGEYDYNKQEGHSIVLVIGTVTLGCAVVALATGTATEGTAAIGRLINPEWYALRSLLDLVTP
jgi:hypothetical protein